MRRNKIPLSPFIALNLIVISLVFLSVFFNLLNQHQFGGTDPWGLFLAGIFLLGGDACLITGIGMNFSPDSNNGTSFAIIKHTSLNLIKKFHTFFGHTIKFLV